ncbi:hypothetical protein [Sansalvadorimonas verongulae]|uniref:hypothetical protein n=1 Tax=Sansalvadorimonas verongulae TaxID=2172824 RepID=UPI0012BCA3AA|nr:hypothetical protein [Sansalvadorimonas verongulae]
MDTDKSKKPEAILMGDDEMEQAWEELREDEQFQACNDPVFDPDHYPERSN